MSDLSKLSDDDLKALYARQTLAQRDVSKLSDDELRAAAYVQPEPPPGVNIHGSDGKNYLTQGAGKKSAMQSEAEAIARYERERDGTGKDVAGSIVRGVPFVGPFSTRAIAALKDGDYAKNLEQEQARDNTYDADHPLASVAGKVGGGVGATLAAAPLAAGSSVAQALLGIGGKTLPQAMVRGGIGGLSQGIASGVGESANIPSMETVKNAGKNGLIGLGLGTFIPAAIGGAGQFADRAMNAGKDALSPLMKQSRSFLEQTFLDPAAVRAQGQDVARLGPNGMLADVSPEWQMVARAGAARPGSRGPVVDALSTRNAGKSVRLQDEANATLGPAKSPLTVKGEIGEAYDKISPEYDKLWPKAKAVDTTAVANKLDAMAIDKRGVGQDVAREIRDMLNISGTKTLDPNPRTLHEVRMAIDKMGSTERGRAASEDLKQIRKMIDDELAAKVPGIKPIDAQWANVSRQKDAYEKGQEVFSPSMWPDEVAKLRSDLVQPAGTAPGPATREGLDRLSQGTRAKIEEVFGNNANDVAALNRLVKGEGDWPRDKIRQIFGKDKADKVLDVLDAERRMEGTYNSVVGGSQTAQTAEYLAWLKDIAKGKEIPTDTTLTGATTRGVQKVANMLLKSGADEKAEQISRELAKLSVATGGDRDAIVQALLQRGVRKSQLQKVYEMGGIGLPGALSPVAAALAGSDRR